MGFFSKLFGGSSPQPKMQSSHSRMQPSPFKIVNGVLEEYSGSYARVVIPQGVTKIGRSAFFDALGNRRNSHLYIQEVILPDGLIEIGNEAFYECRHLSSIMIPKTVKTISRNAFAGCLNLKNIQLPESIENIGSGVFDRTGISTLKFPSNLKMDEVPSDLFRACPNFTGVKLPCTFQSIGAGTFSECPSLKSIVIPEGITEIWGSAFSDCSALREVRLPRSLKKIKENVFKNTHPMIFVYPESSLIDDMTEWGWDVCVIEYENGES